MKRRTWTPDDQRAALAEAEARLSVSPRARLSLRQAAALEGCHPDTLARRRRAGRIRGSGGNTRGNPLTFTLADLGRGTGSPKGE